MTREKLTTAIARVLEQHEHRSLDDEHDRAAVVEVLVDELLAGETLDVVLELHAARVRS